MNKRAIYGLIAIIVVIILIVAVLEVLPSSSTATMTVSSSSATVSVGDNVTFTAFISGGTTSKVLFNFGDGVTGIASHLTGNEYTVTHSYKYAGKYLVTANSTVNGKYINNMKSILEVTVTPATVNPTLASEITLPSIIMNTQLISSGTNLSISASILQPPTATNWTIGYYILNFGDGSKSVEYTLLNNTSGNFMPWTTSHIFSVNGIYPITLGVITFNNTSYVPSNYTLNGNVYSYYPLSDLQTILSSGQYENSTYVVTIVVNSTANLLKNTVPNTNPNQITVTEIVPGGPFSFDPAVDYESVGEEILMNVYETLLQYNGSSTTQLFPMVASEIPTVSNGGISPNYLNYTFNIRSGLKFSNGDPLTAWDVYTSMIRTLLFMLGVTGTPGWILAQDLLPGGGYVSGALSYQNITSAITLDNATQTVTFHLLKPDPAFLYYVADPFGSSITDYAWLQAHGAGITFTPAGFEAYANEGNETDFNNYVRYNAMGSGPYMIKNYLMGQSITLVPNPYYTPIPGVPGYSHAANDTIYIQWEKSVSTGLLVVESGQTDIISGLPTYDYQIISKLASEGKMKIASFPLLDNDYYMFNLNINQTMLPSLGPSFHVPQYYFTNLDVRRAFAYAFNYSNFVNNLLGNNRYGTVFGFQYAGMILKGMPGYLNETQLREAGAVVPTYNLSIAKQYLEESGLYNESVNFPIIVDAGDPINFAAVEDWAAAINSIDPNIVVSPLYMEWTTLFGYEVPIQDPMPIYIGGWYPDYPFPSDYVIPFYQENGSYGISNGYNPQMFEMTGHPNQTAADILMNQYIADAQNTTNVTMALKYYDMAEVIAINLTFYVYTEQENGFWFYSPNIHGVQYEENPMYAGGYDNIYIYLSK
ncbi:MAG: ABC transporter substrate-binding protein [Thermoplasmata archaeon]